MVVRKHKNGNDYLYSGNVWVRNFTKKESPEKDITNLYKKDDFNLILKNELKNQSYPVISEENFNFKKIVIVSDGYDFEKKHLLLSKLPQDVCILAVNGALNKWKLFSYETPEENRRTINGYVINNPYSESMKFMPKKDSKYFPVCISSIRTNFEFLKKYLGDVYTYYPSFNKDFGHDVPQRYHVDDYRNPVCAAISLAYRFNVNKLMLFCCDDSFEEERPNSVRLENGLWSYKPLLQSQDIIDGKFYWLKKFENEKIEVADFSSGKEYNNASYIKNEEEFISFFTDNSEGVNYE